MGVVQRVVDLSAHTNENIQDKSMSLLWNFCFGDAARPQLEATKAFDKTVPLLTSPSGAVRCKVLGFLSEISRPDLTKFIEVGGIEKTLELLRKVRVIVFFISSSLTPLFPGN